MGFEEGLGKVAALLGDKARAIMLWSLLDGKAYTATELANCADISRQSASNHLSQLIEAEMLAVEKQGRHRYFRLANEQVAHAIESMASLIPDAQLYQIKAKSVSQELSFARTCYDHLAGTLGVAITEALVQKGHINPVGNDYQVTASGIEWFVRLDIDLESLKLKKRRFCHKCLDWTERKHHMAGSLGKALLESMLAKDWIRRKQNTREILITPMGKKELNERLGLFDL